MGFRALRFVHGAEWVGPMRTELTDELIRTSTKTRLQAQPAAYVVSNSVVSEPAAISQHGDL